LKADVLALAAEVERLREALQEARPYVEWFTKRENASALDRAVADDVLVLIKLALAVPAPEDTP
jgi:hypothetical protein